MSDATLKQISDFFKTGDAERDKLANFAAEWKQLDDSAKDEIKTLVGEQIGA